MSSKDKNEKENENEKEKKNGNEETLMSSKNDVGHENEDDKTIMSSNEDDDDGNEKMNQNEKKKKIIKGKNDILDEIIDKSKSFEEQIKSIKKLEGLKGYLSRNSFGDKQLKFKYFKIELADM